MGKEGRLTKPAEFALVHAKGSSFADNLLVLRILPNGNQVSRYGISVGKRVGNAVTRNRVKRLLREILRVTPLKPGWDIVLIARGPSSASDYHGLRESATKLLSRAKVLAG